MIRLRTTHLVPFLLGLVPAVALVLISPIWRASAAVNPNESTFVPITPCRLFDFRPAPDQVGAKGTPLGEGQTHTQQVRGTNGNCTIPADAVSVSMNVAITSPSAASFLTLFPADVPLPLAANLNWVMNQAPTSNKVDVKLSASGAINVFNKFGTVNVIADIVGYTTPAGLADLQAQITALQTS